ncbi:MAG: hypothetical protein ACXVZO_05890 [Gaiellaceae bacterium]
MTLASTHLTGIGMAILVAVVGLVAFAAGWVLSDARARGLPWRKALTWAALQGIEFPLFFWLYRRIRPRRIKASS